MDYKANLRRIGNFAIGKDCKISPDAVINVKDGFLGDRSIVKAGCWIEGTRVEIGKEAFLNYGSWIGGGSCFDQVSFLRVGNFLHMGKNSHVNIARGVSLGDEVGIGTETKIFTHGAFLSVLQGFPSKWGSVAIGSRVWLPLCLVQPGVTIGDNVVVAAGSVVNRDIPSGSFAGGTPAKILQENAYPKKANPSVIAFQIVEQIRLVDSSIPVFSEGSIILLYDTEFDLAKMTIKGSETKESEIVKNQLRRNGIRFHYHSEDGKYKKWY